MDSCPYCGKSIPYAERLYGDPTCCGGWRKLSDGMPVALFSEDVLFSGAGGRGAGGAAAGA